MRIGKFFRSNVEGLGTLRNLCVNNLEKVLRFRVKGRFLRAEHVLACFVGVLESVLARCPERQLEQRDNQPALEKLFLWSLYWTFTSALAPEQAKKFESQLFEQVKIEFDRSQSLALCRFEFDSPQGSLRRVEQPAVQLNDSPFLVSEEMEAVSRFVELLLGSKRHVLVVGEETCGKSEFLGYLREVLGTERHCFLRIRLSRDMAYSSFEQLLYRKAKIVVNAGREKQLCALNGKQLVLMLDDLNLLDESSPIGTFLKSVLSQGYYYDALTLEKIHLGNLVVLAAENSTYQPALSYEFTRCFKPVHLQAPPLRELVELYHPFLNPHYAAQLCHHIASLHEFALAHHSPDIYFRRTIALPCRLLRLLRSYQGREDIVKVWEYASLKLYLQAGPPDPLFAAKLTAEVKNYSNLMLTNSQQEPSPIDSQDTFLRDLLARHPFLSLDPQHPDYYVFVALILQLSKPFSLFTINEPLCASLKEQVLFALAAANHAEYLRPFRAHDISQRPHSDARVLAFLSDSDPYFHELLEAMLADPPDNLIFLVDFTDDSSWRATIDKHPSLAHFASTYYKQPQPAPHPDLPPQQAHHLLATLALFPPHHVRPHSQQEIARVVGRTSEKLERKVQEIVGRKEGIWKTGRSLGEREGESRREVEQLRAQLEELAKAEERKRRELLQLKNNYQPDPPHHKNERNDKIQAIEIELNEIMALRRHNEDRTRTAAEDIARIQKITAALAPPLQRIRTELQTATTISHHLPQVVVFLAVLEYFYTKQEAECDGAIEAAARSLPLAFEDIMECLFGCRVGLREKLGVLWLFADKSIIAEDSSGELARFL